VYNHLFLRGCKCNSFPYIYRVTHVMEGIEFHIHSQTSFSVAKSWLGTSK